MKKLICEVLLDDIFLLSTANEEVVDALTTECLHDMPKNRFDVNFNLWLWP